MISAEVHSDDYKVEIHFDATEYFQAASGSDLVDLVRCGWGGDYPGDYVALHFESRETASLFEYLSLRPEMYGESVGFECHVDEGDAMAWIAQNRPELMIKLENSCDRED